jgi:hypothetical protein
MTFPGVPEKKGTEIPLYSPAPTESDRLKAENELQPLPQSQSSALANAPTAPQAEPETRTTGGTEIIPSVPDGSKAAVRYREMAPFWT